MHFSVIIPAFNEEAYLPATLDAVRTALDATGLRCEVIVVDNASTDDTRAVAIAGGAVVVHETERSIARARNHGAGTARGDVLCFIDADTTVPTELFDTIWRSMQDRRCAGGAVAVEYGELRRRWMRWYLRGWEFWSRLFDMKQGAAQFCRREVFERLGGYDEDIHVGEDIDFYWRMSRHARAHGGYVKYLTQPKVVTSARRFDRMNVWRTLLLTHPLFIRLNWKRRAFWRDWYDRAVR